jgi:hypothetical protein
LVFFKSLFHKRIAKLNQVAQDLGVERIILIARHDHLLEPLQIGSHSLKVSIVRLRFCPDLPLKKPAVLRETLDLLLAHLLQVDEGLLNLSETRFESLRDPLVLCGLIAAQLEVPFESSDALRKQTV